jgi:hypothetical protein
MEVSHQYVWEEDQGGGGGGKTNGWTSYTYLLGALLVRDMREFQIINRRFLTHDTQQVIVNEW